VDDELNPEEQAALRQFLQAHPVLQQELTILQDTKLPAEEIPFPDKTSLYRRQSGSGQLRSLPRRTYRRIALAVACMAAGLVMAIYLWGTNSPVDTSSSIQPSIAVHRDTPAAHREKQPASVPQLAITHAADKPVSPPIQQGPPPVPSKPKAPPPVPVSTAALTPLTPLPTVHAAQTVEPQVALATPEVPQPMQEGESPESGERGIIGTAAALAAAKDGLDEVITEKVSNAHRSTRDWVDHLAKKGVTIGNLTIALKD
jgi:type IV secretory pathway VirB10-like protein